MGIVKMPLPAQARYLAIRELRILLLFAFRVHHKAWYAHHPALTRSSSRFAIAFGSS
jgi:hypothetical protein